MLYDIESIKQLGQKNSDIAEQLRKRFPLNQYSKKMKPKSISNEKDLMKELNVSDHFMQGLDKNNVKTKKALEITQLLQRTIKLAMVLGGANGTELENKTLRFASPRLLSMVPDNVKDQ
ncbi:unnamed protein product, partial [Onchocerca ochengi]|uniref:Uncharacterized protein n=1 Tax=Onchocerca ochengi TaxID=42157 RepID=A0A182EYG7_ONCOC